MGRGRGQKAKGLRFLPWSGEATEWLSLLRGGSGCPSCSCCPMSSGTRLWQQGCLTAPIAGMWNLRMCWYNSFYLCNCSCPWTQCHGHNNLNMNKKLLEKFWLLKNGPHLDIPKQRLHAFPACHISPQIIYIKHQQNNIFPKLKVYL